METLIIYLIGVVLSFITCWILYIYDIKHTYGTKEKRKKEFIDNILWALFIISLISLLSWAIVISVSIILFVKFMNTFFKFIMNNTNIGKFIIHKIFD